MSLKLYSYFARGSGCEVLWWVCLSVCLSVCPRGYLRSHTRDLYQIFLRVACIRGSVLLRHVYDRPHRVSPGRGFLPNRKCIIDRQMWMGVDSAGEVCYLRLPCFRTVESLELRAQALHTSSICQCLAVWESDSVQYVEDIRVVSVRLPALT